MTTIEMTSEFDYFTISRTAIVDKLVADGYAHNVTERVARIVQRLAESRSGFHKPGAPKIDADQRYVPSDAYLAAIRDFIKGATRPGEFGGVRENGTLQFDSFADEDYGSYWVIDLHHKNVYRGEAFEYRYLVMFMEGAWTGNINLAFTCDDMDTVDEVVRPATADLACANPDCQGYLQCSDGYTLRTEQDFRYEPERGEYDAEGIYCPFCTSYSTGYPGTIDGVLMVNTRGDAVYLPHQYAAEGDVQEPFHLRATFRACE